MQYLSNKKLVGNTENRENLPRVGSLEYLVDIYVQIHGCTVT